MQQHVDVEEAILQQAVCSTFWYWVLLVSHLDAIMHMLDAWDGLEITYEKSVHDINVTWLPYCIINFLLESMCMVPIVFILSSVVEGEMKGYAAD